MIRLTCTVRGCGRPLVADGATLRCPGNHTFDRARAGYWNLLQPQDRRSLLAGDRDESTEARDRWLARGFAIGLAEALARQVGDSARRTVLDVGCGGGWFTTRICHADAFRGGIDLSREAISRACRRDPDAVWVVANADRGLPIADRSIDVALSIFGRRPAAELRRVVAAGGRIVVAVPGEDDLAELREAAFGEATRRDRSAAVVDEFAGAGLQLEAREAWRNRQVHDATGLDELLKMTYRGSRHSERERLRAALGTETKLAVTLSAEVLRFTPQGSRN